MIILAVHAPVAHADPDVFLTASQAHAGDAVHFSISDVDERVRYDVEVADRDVLKGEASAADERVTIAAQFTMPDLGPSPRSVTVEIEARDDDGTTTLKRKLQYLGHAPAAEAPPAPAPAAAQPQPAPATAPAPSPSPAATSGPADRKRTGSRRKQRKRGHARRQKGAARTHEAAADRPRRARRAREQTPAPQRKEHTRARRAPLFDGVPEADTGGAQAGTDGLSTARRTKTPAAVAVSPVASRKDDEPALAILVPGVLALAGFLLAAATLLRRRRLR